MLVGTFRVWAQVYLFCLISFYHMMAVFAPGTFRTWQLRQSLMFISVPLILGAGMFSIEFDIVFTILNKVFQHTLLFIRSCVLALHIQFLFIIMWPIRTIHIDLILLHSAIFQRWVIYFDARVSTIPVDWNLLVEYVFQYFLLTDNLKENISY